MKHLATARKLRKRLDTADIFPIITMAMVGSNIAFDIVKGLLHPQLPFVMSAAAKPPASMKINAITFEIIEPTFWDRFMVVLPLITLSIMWSTVMGLLFAVALKPRGVRFLKLARHKLALIAGTGLFTYLATYAAQAAQSVYFQHAHDLQVFRGGEAWTAYLMLSLFTTIMVVCNLQGRGAELEDEVV